MTKDEFVEYYAANSKVTTKQILSWRVPIPCNCGEDECLGWQMMSKSAARGLPFEGRSTMADEWMRKKARGYRR